jgi:hypothetical protein
MVGSLNYRLQSAPLTCIITGHLFGRLLHGERESQWLWGAP